MLKGNMVIALVIITLMAVSCMFNTNIGAGDFHLEKEAPATEVFLDF